MPNTQTSVPAFVASQVLTAQQQTEINTGIPVFATTVTRDAAFGGTGEKTLAEGQFAYIEATNATQYYDGAAWQSVGASSGLTLISSTTISAAATTNVNDVFSATYDNYKIIFNGTASTGVSALGSLRLRVGGADATTNYTYQRIYGHSSTNVADRDIAGTDEFFLFDTNASVKFGADVTLLNPFNAAATKFLGLTLSDNNSIGIYNTYQAGVNTNATSYTGFSIVSAGTISGVLKVYGMAN